MKHAILAVLISLGCWSQAMAWQLKGKLTDPTGEAIPYANVYVENTTNGVVTNVKGEFFLELDNGTYNLVFQSLGYTKKTIEVTIANAHQHLDVVLEPETIVVDTVQVTAKKKDRAYEIMAEVIKNKKQYIQQFESYKCQTYLKASLEVDTLPRKRKRDIPDSLKAKPEPKAGSKDGSKANVEESSDDDDKGIAIGGPPKERPRLNFIESRSTTYYQYPNRYKSIVTAYRDLSQKSGGGSSISFGDDGVEVDEYQTQQNNPYLFYLDIADADFNFYRNLLSLPDLGDRPFISPLSATAWRIAYKYQLEETFYDQGRVIYKIKVTPRSQYGPYFEGHIWVVDGLWALKSVNLQIVRSDLEFFNYFQVIHNYERTEEGKWVTTREDFYYNTKEGRKRFYGNTIVLHDDYELDVEHPKRFFGNELRRVEKEAYERDSIFWAETRPITLKKAELDFIHVQDSIREYHQSDEYLHEIDSTYNRIKFWDPFLSGLGFRNRKAGMEYFINPLIAQIRPFGVGGYRHALGGHVSHESKRYYKIRVAGELDYGFTNRDLRGNVRVGFTYAPKRFARAYVKYGNIYSMINSNATLSDVLARGNFVNKIYYGVGHEFELFNGFMLDIEGEFADRRSIDQLELAEWSAELFGELSNTPVSFDEYREALITIRIKYTPGQKYHMEPYRKVVVGSKWPTFRVEYRKSIPDIFGSDLNSDFLEINVSDEFRPGTFGISRWNIYAGRFLQADNLRFTDFKFFRGSDRWLFANPLRAFQLLGPTISTKNAYLQGHYLHDFSGTLISKIPLLRRTPLQLTGGAGILAIEDGSFLHGEVYAGLQLPFRLAKQRFKFGTYYVGAYSNYGEALSSQIKLGITYFNSWLNKWEY